MKKQTEVSPEERSKALKSYWLINWSFIAGLPLLLELGIYLRLEGNPYTLHVRLAVYLLLAATTILTAAYLPHRVKCPLCEGLYFGGDTLRSLKPNKKCSACGK